MRRRDAGGRWFPGLFPALRPALGGIRKASRPLLGKRVLRQAAVARLDPPGNAATPGPRPGRDPQGRALGRRPGAARAPVSEGPPPAGARRQEPTGRASLGRFATGPDAGGLPVHVVVGVPGEVAAVVVAGDVGQVGVRDADLPVGRLHPDGYRVAGRLPETDHGASSPAALVLAQPHLVADLELFRRHLDGVEELTEAQVLRHGLVEGAKHLVEIVGALLLARLHAADADGLPVLVVFRREALGDAPAVDDVDAVVPGIHARVVGVGADADRQRAAEEVADDLADACPPVAVGAGRAVALELAVPKQRLDGVAAAVPMQVEPDLPLARGDDRPVSHPGPPSLSWLRPVPSPVGGLSPQGASGRKGGRGNRRLELPTQEEGFPRPLRPQGPCGRMASDGAARGGAGRRCGLRERHHPSQRRRPACPI